jgi:hypothetical protein
MADAHMKSHVFSLLKGNPSWLTPFIEPPLPRLLPSVLSRDIILGVQWAAVLTAKWLLRAGTPPGTPDGAGEHCSLLQCSFVLPLNEYISLILMHLPLAHSFFTLMNVERLKKV